MSVIRGFCCSGVRCIGALFHPFYRNFGRAEELRSLYTGDFVTVVMFHCILIKG